MVKIRAITIILLASCGCGTYKQAVETTNVVDLCAINYSRNMENIVNALIDDYKTKAYAEADKLAEDAIKAETGPDGKANAINLQLIIAKKMEHYQQIEMNALNMQKKVMTAHLDIDYLLQYTGALRNYFDNKTKIETSMILSNEKLIALLEKLKPKVIK